MQNTKQVEKPVVSLSVVEMLKQKGFELWNEEEDYVDFERNTDIDDESNFRERITFCTETNDWYASLSISADVSAKEDNFGCSENSKTLADCFNWLSSQIEKAKASLK